MKRSDRVRCASCCCRSNYDCSPFEVENKKKKSWKIHSTSSRKKKKRKQKIFWYFRRSRFSMKTLRWRGEERKCRERENLWIWYQPCQLDASWEKTDGSWSEEIDSFTRLMTIERRRRKKIFASSSFLSSSRLSKYVHLAIYVQKSNTDTWIENLYFILLTVS